MRAHYTEEAWEKKGCRICGEPAKHAVGEIIGKDTNLSSYASYLCCLCFGFVMGKESMFVCVYHAWRNKE